MMGDDWIVPDWPAPATVRSLVTTRNGGVSAGPYRSFNLGDHVGDDPVAVAANRARLRSLLPGEPLWLRQVHGSGVADFDRTSGIPEADGAVARRPGSVCAVLTADCLPVLLCDRGGTVVAAAHAGWRGLAAGVLEQAVYAMRTPGQELIAWLGPAIGPAAFEVGDEVRRQFVAQDEAAQLAFSPHGKKWLADIYELARQRLTSVGVTEVYGGRFCTVTNGERFFSFRRDGATGRMAALVWLDEQQGTQ